MDLTRLGTLKLSSLPFNGAKVYIDGIYRGDTPLTITLPIGNHNIKFKMDGYSDKENNLTLMSGDVKDITIDMRDSGYLSVISDPLGATVFVDGKKIDITPMQKTQFIVGTHQITLKAFNYQPYTSIIQIEKDRTLALNIKLKPVSSIEVDSFPSGATVYFDGKMVGQSPVIINNVYSGNHFVRVEKRGYTDQKKNITIGSGENRKMYFYLKEAPLTVDIKINKSGNNYVINYTSNKLCNLSAYVENQSGDKVLTLFEDKLTTPNTYSINEKLDLSSGSYSIVFEGKAPGGNVKKFAEPLIIPKLSSFDNELFNKIVGIASTILALIYIISVNGGGQQ